jgi:AcrR family transcriptional regulator
MSASHAALAEPAIETSNRSRPEVSHNLFGQRLGRKGQETRERILAAALRLLELSNGVPLTLSAVAREASVGMTTLYLYFPDLGDLMLAVLTRVTSCADAAFENQLGTRWPDETLHASCLSFLRSYYEFWGQHAQVLNMRNRYADAGDNRFLEYRTRATRPLITALIRQMDSDSKDRNSASGAMATILMVGFERLAFIINSPTFFSAIKDDGIFDENGFIERLILSEAEVMALVIRQQRSTSKHDRKQPLF